jgi:hypothetical protein
MTWFRKRRLATVDAADMVTLCIRRPDAIPLCIPVSNLPWFAVLRLGDSFYGGEGGWCMLPNADRAVAVDLRCPGAQEAIRGPLHQALDTAARRLRIDLSGPPPRLRAARDGIALLTGAEASALLASPYAVPLRSVLDLPWIP